MACHCVQCRKGSGHFNVSTAVPREAAEIVGPVQWYAYKPGVRRGFCPTCGAQVAWDNETSDKVWIDMGLLEGPTGTRLSRHLYVSEKGDYYRLDDGLPREETE